MDRLFEVLCMPHSRAPALSIDEAKKLNFNDLLSKVNLDASSAIVPFCSYYLQILALGPTSPPILVNAIS